MLPFCTSAAGDINCFLVVLEFVFVCFTLGNVKMSVWKYPISSNQKKAQWKQMAPSQLLQSNRLHALLWHGGGGLIPSGQSKMETLCSVHTAIIGHLV